MTLLHIRTRVVRSEYALIESGGWTKLSHKGSLSDSLLSSRFKKCGMDLEPSAYDLCKGGCCSSSTQSSYWGLEALKRTK